MSKRRKIIINEMEVTLESMDEEDENREILSYTADNDNFMEIVQDNHEAFVTTEQFTMEDGTIVQYIQPEYVTENEFNDGSADGQNFITIVQQDMQESEQKEVESYPFSIVSGEKSGTFLLYSNRQLYKNNRKVFYRCRLYPQCSGSGRIVGDMFHLVQSHNDHPDQEEYKESLKLFNTLKLKSKNNPENFHIIFKEECAKEESSVVDETKNKFLSLNILKRNRDAFYILMDLLGEIDNSAEMSSDIRPFNNFEKSGITNIDGLDLRTRIIYSAGHIYLHTGTSMYRCYLYPKCMANGNLTVDNNKQYFQLVEAHSQHGFKDDERDILMFIVAVKKRVQNNSNDLEEIYQDELDKECYLHIRDKISLEKIIKLFTKLGTVISEDNGDFSKDGLEKIYLKKPRPYTIVDGGGNGHVLYCDGHLYNNNNRAGYYRCRLYQSGCPATGTRDDQSFVLTRMHLGHGDQKQEKIKLQLTAVLRHRAANETLPLQKIYNEEIKKPEFVVLHQKFPYHSFYKIMKRARVQRMNKSENKISGIDIKKNVKKKDIVKSSLIEASETYEISIDNELNANNSLVEVKLFTPDDDNKIENEENSTFITSTENPNTVYRVDMRNNKIKNPQFPCMEYSLMEGERLGSCILYSNEQLYTLNRNNYYRCRMYPQGCQATGMREENYFRLCRGHSGHGSQEPERRRIILINTIKKRTMANPDPDYFESVFNEECERPEYADIVEKVSFTMILNNMRKIWKRYQQQDPTLTRNIMRTDTQPEDLHHKMAVRESKDKVEKVPVDYDENDDVYIKMAVEIGDDVHCDQDTTPKEFTMMEGERLGSCLLYSNQQLYTNNQRNYYRCRMYSIGCRATGIIKNNFFELLRPHNGHGSQEREVRRLVLITRIKRRAQIDPSRLQIIYNEECSKPEFSDVAEMISYKKIYSTLDRCRRRAANDIFEVVEPKIPPGIPIVNTNLSDIKVQWSGNANDVSNDNNEKNIPMEYFIENVVENNNSNDSEEITTEILLQETDDQSQVSSENTSEPMQVQVSKLTEFINNDDSSKANDDNDNVEIINECDSTIEELNNSNEATCSSKFDESTMQGENFTFIGGDRLGSKLLYSESQIYCLSRDNYFRCRVYPNCIATGRIYTTVKGTGHIFRLHRGHTKHPLQEDEKNRLNFINALKTRVQDDLTTPIKDIFDDECSKPEHKQIATSFSYKSIFGTLMKCRTRSQTIVEKQNKSTNENESNNDFASLVQDLIDPSSQSDDDDDILNANWDLDEFSDNDEDQQIEIPKPELNVPCKYSLIQGDRTGSLILYSNGHLYTRNRGFYYRCRLHPNCSASGNRRGGFFYMTRQHINHPLQDEERCRLSLLNAVKKRVLHENTPLKVIFDEEISKPEYAPIADLVSFKMIQSTMIKIRERLKYGQEPGTVTLSTEIMPCSKYDNDDQENLEFDDTPETDEEELFVEKKSVLNTESVNENVVYYYVFDDNDIESENENLNFESFDSVQREYLNSPKIIKSHEHLQNAALNPLAVYTVDFEANSTKLNRKVHLPEESITQNSSWSDSYENISKEVENQELIPFQIIEDCLNEQLLLYANKQLYIKKSTSLYACRIKKCQAVGRIRNGMFLLLYNHINHQQQNKVKRQLQLIARIRSRCLERRTARVSKVFREECTKPEFRSIANTVTLDGMSEMVRRYRKKMFPKLVNNQLDVVNNAILSELPPPVEFSLVNGTTPDVRLLYCCNALFYHASKSVYKCHVPGCSSFGRRDRIFFQVLAQHTEHEIVDINDKDRLLEIIKQTEEMISKKHSNDDETNQDTHSSNIEPLPEPSEPTPTEFIQPDEIKFEIQTDDETGNEENLDSEQLILPDSVDDNINIQTSTKSILQQAWEELQVHI